MRGTPIERRSRLRQTGVAALFFDIAMSYLSSKPPYLAHLHRLRARLQLGRPMTAVDRACSQSPANVCHKSGSPVSARWSSIRRARLSRPCRSHRWHLISSKSSLPTDRLGSWNRGYSLQKPKTRVAADDLDIADVFDYSQRTGIAPHRGLLSSLARSGCAPERAADWKKRSRLMPRSTL
jgi:hypothetical protein